MGKSTTANIFREFGVPVWDADQSVHQLYQGNRKAMAQISELCPEAVSKDGVDRAILAQWLSDRPDRLEQLEKVVHPLIALDRDKFVSNTKAPVLVLDIPLLFETGKQDVADAIVVVTTTPDEQRRRVLSRQGMTPERFKFLVQQQLPDSEKRAKADYVIRTESIESARTQVSDVLRDIQERLQSA